MPRIGIRLVPCDGMADTTHVDVVICGGGLSGLTLARQLHQSMPTLSIVVLERTERPLPTACHKVGESSVELGSSYLQRLGLGEYLETNHIIKFGLRFFPGGGEQPLHNRTELGPSQEPVLRSYQIDRGTFEADLREMIDATDVLLLEGCKVEGIALNDHGRHRVTAVHQGEVRNWSCRWVIDATGRNPIIKKQLRLRRGTSHPAHASWFRVKGRVDIASWVPADAESWHGADFASQRWRSTVHLMGSGYWVWLIPLSSGHTSIGVVVHEELHGVDRIRSYESTLAFLREHEPVAAEHLAAYPPLDFRYIKGYSHGVARSWSPQRWAIVGEAGAFVDPLYSPGTDFIAFANTFTEELIRVDLDPQQDDAMLDLRCRELNLQYRALVAGAVGVYRQAAPIYGHAQGMATKIYWDNYAYWAFPCQYFFQRIYQVSGSMHDRITQAGARFVMMSDQVQQLVRAWAELAPQASRGRFIGLPTFPSLLVDVHLDLQKSMTPDETLAYVIMRADQGEELVREILIRILVELGPERAATLLERTGAATWNITIPPERLDAENLRGLERRHALSPVARDLERGLGKIDKHPNWKAALDLLKPVAMTASAPL